MVDRGSGPFAPPFLMRTKKDYSGDIFSPLSLFQAYTLFSTATSLEVMLRDDVKAVSSSPQLTKDANSVDNLLKISFLRNYALPLIMRDPSLYDLDAFYDHSLLSFLTAVSTHYDGYEAAFQQYDNETHQLYFGVSKKAIGNPK